MNLADIARLVAEAAQLLAAHPLHWAVVVALFLVTVEALMFLPWVGFVLKLTVSSLLACQMVALWLAAAGGLAPAPQALFQGLGRPWSALWALWGAALIPFLAGMAFLAASRDRAHLRFFFGRVLRDPAPPAGTFFRLKLVMQLCALPFTFVAGAVLLAGLGGTAAWTRSAQLAAVHPLPLALLLAFGLCQEWAAMRLPAWARSAVGVTTVLLVQALCVAAELAFVSVLTHHAYADAGASSRGCISAPR
ncbi:hypothetical protein [Ideonella sp.]|uniref:hypothetical protein n=1 Tax=Ideonella sp. TaxID=1929293 RepID=UPI0035AE06C0